jgi:hypothetical protein
VEKYSQTEHDALPERTLVVAAEMSYRRESFVPGGPGPAGAGRAGGFVSGAFWRSGAVALGGILAYENSRHLPAGGGVFALDRVSPGVFFRADLTLTPTAGIFATRWRLREATETGLPAGATIFEGWQDRTLYAQSGIDFAVALLDRRFTVRVSGRWLHELDSARQLGVRFAGAPDRFSLAGVPADRDLLQGGLRAEFRIGRTVDANFGASVTHGRVARMVSEFSGGIRWQF